MADYERVRTEDKDYRDDDMREGEGHATTGGAAATGAITGGVVGAVGGGPIGAAIGAVGGAIVGAVAERAMHADDALDRGTGATETTTYRSDVSGTPSTMGPDHEHSYLDSRCSSCGFVRPD